MRKVIKVLKFRKLNIIKIFLLILITFIVHNIQKSDFLVQNFKSYSKSSRTQKIFIMQNESNHTETEVEKIKTVRFSNPEVSSVDPMELDDRQEKWSPPEETL